jgi:archaellum component FlaC
MNLSLTIRNLADLRFAIGDIEDYINGLEKENEDLQARVEILYEEINELKEIIKENNK